MRHEANVKTTTDTGAKIEKVVLNFLIKEGLKKVTANYRCKLGEIDLIMLEDKTLVFVEVRFRKQDTFGGGAASVTLAKQRKLAQTASLYVQRNNVQSACRFDVVDVSSYEFTRNANKSAFNKNVHHNYQINWIRDAFLPPE